MNRAPTRGFEEDVGARTTHHLMYPESAVNLDNDTNLVLIPYKTQDLQWLISAFTTGTIKHKLRFEANCEAVYKKANQRLHCLRKLSSFHIDRKMLTMFYRCFIESVISFCLVSWFSNLPLKNKNSLNQIVRWASRLIGEPHLNLETLYTRQLQRLVGYIKDGSHPLHGEFQPLPPGRRFKMPAGNTKSTYQPVMSRIKANREKVQIFSPTFMKYTKDNWMDKHGRYPSTGFFSLLFALHICDEVSVFGYGADKHGNWHHYFEDNVGNGFRKTGVHGGEHEYNMMVRLNATNKIRMFS
ncbi:CMP-N-acetylneuraminate-beta-galactosamide-alpha-2,3-sialyltransferase 1 [Merluccius polli]|nr:CMP-N-acetylneuraminate-beta-galactosamide-alpha-2,3-sialyltransferase 1 [Merluccius polli]